MKKKKEARTDTTLSLSYYVRWHTLYITILQTFSSFHHYLLFLLLYILPDYWATPT